ncbi:MAG TPA: hypothetical protein VFC19_03320 [Candidatus Limnocylindrales bacterium]|nr:hypothetical protein [Candidatus Limnocylindrales bacterium]
MPTTPRWVAAIAAATCFILLPTPPATAAAAADPDIFLPVPTATTPTHHPRAVPGSTRERLAAMKRLDSKEREQLAAKLAKAPKPPLTQPKQADPWRAWADVVAGKASTSGATNQAGPAPRFTQRPATKTRSISGDADADGLDDGFEDAVADAFTPIYQVGPSYRVLMGSGARFISCDRRCGVVVGKCQRLSCAMRTSLWGR